MIERARQSVSGDYVFAELRQQWLTLRLNQPDKRNALSDGMISELLAVLNSAAADDSVRGVTLRGRGGVFCAGGDLASFRDMATASREQIIDTSMAAARLFSAINAFPKPTIALVEGAAMAGGLGIVCCCDVAFGIRSAMFGFSETRLGITPAQIAPYVVDRLGIATARRLLVTGARFDGDTAAGLGLLDGVANDVAELERLEDSVCDSVLRCAPGAIASTKQLLMQLSDTDRADIPRLAAENFATAMQSPEGLEGIAGFLEKRKPYWDPEH